MSITISLPAQVEARVEAEAARQHKTPAALVADLVSQALPQEDEISRRERSLTLLRSVDDIGDEAEQRETFNTLQTAIEEDRLSGRKRFA